MVYFENTLSITERTYPFFVSDTLLYQMADNAISKNFK